MIINIDISFYSFIIRDYSNINMQNTGYTADV